MGETLPEIAASLMSTWPRNGVLVTAERNPGVTVVMETIAASLGTEVVYADPEMVTDEDIARFDYIAFRDNVAIGLTIAAMLGIDREVAMTGMVKAPPDPGVLRTKDLEIGGKRVTWANLSAVLSSFLSHTHVSDKVHRPLRCEAGQAMRGGDVGSG